MVRVREGAESERSFWIVDQKGHYMRIIFVDMRRTYLVLLRWLCELHVLWEGHLILLGLVGGVCVVGLLR